MKKITYKKILAKAGIYFAAIALLLWTILPMLWMLLSSLTPTADLLILQGPWISGRMNLERYLSIFVESRQSNAVGDVTVFGSQFVNSLQNSIFIAILTVAFAVALGGFAAYTFARLKMRHKNILLMTTMFFQLVPPITLVIPMYVIARLLNFIDKLPFLIVLYMSFTLPYVIWVLNGYYKTISPDLETAALIDGCTWFSAYRLIVLPLAKPGLIAVGILSFLMCWDEFIYALIFMTSAKSKTMPVAISEFGTRFGIDYGMVCTAGCIATIFPMVLTLVFQKHIVSGLTAGGIKD